MVSVFIWMPKIKDGTSDIGHGSMQVNSEYISNWPGELKSILWSGKGDAKDQFESDKKLERGMPTYIYILKGLDEEAMESRWLDMKKDLKYSFATFNCFTTVAEVLHHGIGGWKQTAAELFPYSAILAHVLLLQYCEAIKLLYNGHRIAT